MLHGVYVEQNSLVLFQPQTAEQHRSVDVFPICLQAELNYKLPDCTGFGFIVVIRGAKGTGLVTWWDR
jgi:hypothetical protein